jgi:16S rRNA (uracil1498-N3)-methyltransferase
MPRFFVPSTQIRDAQVFLSGREFHHLRHVLRLGIGDTVTLCDEQSREYPGTILHLSPTRAEIRLGASSHLPSQKFALTLAQGVLKGPKMDLLIEKATEIGVQHIMPFFSAFTIAHLPEERHAERLARWQRIAQSAAKQSGSAVPLISAPRSFTEVLATTPQECGRLLLYEKEQTLTLKTFAYTHPTFFSLCIVVGPEGGFAPAEVEQARGAGFAIVGLGTHTLRAETAGMVAVALCRFLWGAGEIPPLPSPG